ncbi:SURF1 family protein [Polymorphospora rubra]|uniref:SURF1-like protein n=1 Tax=Polymorphospora rubra TaxID=338584 RepID=A0A810MW83_9ACTN|nr:SURF1 family protein [Polymorphospora rubra]BCJ63893.1 SURF1-like protein [Polymorphospora rubra]
MYRFLLTPRWLGILALTVAASVVMVMLGNWQLSRYEQRSAINERIDAAGRLDPVPLTEVLAAPGGGAGTAGPAPHRDAAWTRVTVTGRYDSTNVVLVRARSVESRVGFEIVVPLVLADGTAVLVDRGWVPPAPGGAAAQPEVPPAPEGEVTIVGRVHLSESQPGTIGRRDGRIETRRIAVPELAAELPYPTYGAYLLVDEQTPAADAAFVPIPIRHENNWQNGGYVVQWWLFAGMALVGYGYVARREAHARSGKRRPRGDRLEAPAVAPPAAATRD